MMLKRYMFFLSVLAFAVSCGKENGGGDTPVTPGADSDIEVNGTRISDGNYLYGLIKNSVTGEGIAGVPVSDGYTVTVTDANGVYQFKSDLKSRYVFYTTPSAYKVRLDPTSKTPSFYSVKKIPRKQYCRNDFTLEPLDSQEEKFSLVMIADPQVKNTNTVNIFKTTTMEDFSETLGSDRERYGNVYAFALGDIVNSTSLYDLWAPVGTTLARVKLSDGTFVPVFKCIGNHDLDNRSGVASDYDAVQPFIDNFGPTDYSLNRGNVHIVVMDNMVFKRISSSAAADVEEYFTSERLEWLRQDLALIPDKGQKTIVFCCHGPFLSSKHASAKTVLSMLSQFKEAHIMCGHTHYSRNNLSSVKSMNGTQIYEHNQATASGVRYNGDINRNGAPIGYGIYVADKDGICDWVEKSTGFPEDFQMKIYNGADTYTANDSFSWSSEGYGKGWFIVNVWNEDSAYWKVEFVHNGTVTTMKRVFPATDVNAATFLTDRQKLDDNSFAKISTLYVMKAPGGDPLKESGWTVRATQTIPGSGKVNVYESNTFQRDYTGME